MLQAIGTLPVMSPASPALQYWGDSMPTTFGEYLSLVNTTTTSITVSWRSMGESGNSVTDPTWNLELWQPNDYNGVNVKRERPSLDTRSWTFTGLTPGTQYEVKLYANRQKDRAIDYLQNVRTNTPSYPVPSAATLNLSVSGRTIYISGTAGANTDIIDLYRDGVYWTYFNMRSSSTYSTTFTGDWGRTYTFKVIPENGYGSGPATEKSIRVPNEPLPDPPPAPSGFRIYSQNENSASFTWNAVSTADKYAMEIFQGGVRKDYDYNILSTTKTFTGLSPGIQYLAKLYGYNAGGNGTPVSFYFTLGYTRPSNFEWTIIKAKGRSYRLENGRFADLVSYDELVAFRQRINDFRRYKGLSFYTFTNVARGTLLSSTLYNQLNNSINDMAPPTRPPGTRVSGAGELPGLLNGVRNALNSIP